MNKITKLKRIMHNPRLINRLFIMLSLLLVSLGQVTATDINWVNAPGTTYSSHAIGWESYVRGSEDDSHDENSSTYYGISYFCDGDCGTGGGSNIELKFEAQFPQPIEVSRIRSFFAANAEGFAYAGGTWSWRIEYYDGSWHTLAENSGYDGAGDGNLNSPYEIDYSGLSLNGVTKVKYTGNAECMCECGWPSACGCDVACHELYVYGPPFYVDIGLRVYDGSRIISIACEPAGTLTSPLRIAKNGVAYGIVLVDTSNPHASNVRIRTNSGVKALRKL